MYKLNVFIIVLMAISVSLFSRGTKGTRNSYRTKNKLTNVKAKKSSKTKNKINNKIKNKEKSSIEEGGIAHPFTLMSTKRRFKSLKKIMNLNKDKDIFLIFFTTSCKSCVKERTKVIEMAKKDDKILPILIGVRNPKDETISEFNESIKKIISDENIKYDVYLDLYSTVAKFYKVKEGSSITVPKLFIVNSNTSKIVKIVSGYDEKLAEMYENLYKKN